MHMKGQHGHRKPNHKVSGEHHSDDGQKGCHARSNQLWRVWKEQASPRCSMDVYFRYCSSLTCSFQSTVLPSRFSWIAICVIAVVGVAPCQCFSPGANQTTSPGRIS